jgi:hypothetical protein
VWSQGQVYGYCFAILGASRVLANSGAGLAGPGPGYALLSLAAGCRPFYAFYLPFFVALDRATCGRGLRAIARDVAVFFIPYGLAMAAYNGARFGDPLEFGHALLPHSQSLEHGVFSAHYLPRNLDRAFLALPRLGEGSLVLDFHGRGTAFWLNNPIFAVALLGLGGGTLPRLARAGAALSLAAVGAGLLLHESGGWFQFGCRYLIDLLPIGFVLLVHRFRTLSPALAHLALLSLIVNLYGIYWHNQAKGLVAP